MKIRDILSEAKDPLSQWKNQEPVNYTKHLQKTFGKPDELTTERAVWHNKDDSSVLKY